MSDYQEHGVGSAKQTCGRFGKLLHIPRLVDNSEAQQTACEQFCCMKTVVLLVSVVSSTKGEMATKGGSLVILSCLSAIFL